MKIVMNRTKDTTDHKLAARSFVVLFARFYIQVHCIIAIIEIQKLIVDVHVVPSLVATHLVVRPWDEGRDGTHDKPSS